jgi:phosphoribosylamine--glycine ligase
VKVLVVGNGGREHALAWKLLQSEKVTKIFCTPGNGGTATLANCENVRIAVDDFAAIVNLVQSQAIDLVVVGPELPLSLGITDYLQQYQIPVFGPNQAGATIEASKTWAKDLMDKAGIPTAKSATFTDLESAKNYIQAQGAPIVIKADGLAAGKGVVVAMDLPEALTAVTQIFAQYSPKVVIEEFLLGQEVSVLAITDGVTIRPLIPAQDHKRIGEGDTGPNTGGMGAYAPTPIVDEFLAQRIEQEVLQPTITELRARGIDYRGVLYAGLMITPEGEPKILEFNCRFGDPETQAVLPMLKTPLIDILQACCQQKLVDLPPLEWYEGTAVCVVAASQGYPGNYTRGQLITGIDLAENQGAIVFQAGTKLEQGQLVTDGGRVLSVTYRSNNFEQAITNCYQALQNNINFEGIYYRRDIGHRLLKLEQQDNPR